MVHLDDWYAQSHPDEDFAETFAVWLTPDLDWRARYRRWKALHKLEYVDALMRSLAGQPPPALPAYRVKDLDCLNVKLRTYYARKRKQHEDEFPDFYDNDLRQLFAASADVAGRIRASVYLKRTAGSCWRRSASGPTSGNTVHTLLARLIDRCDELGLFIKVRPAPKPSGRRLHHDADHEPPVHREIQTHQIAAVSRSLKALALFDAIAPTTLDQDLSAELKTVD